MKRYRVTLAAADGGGGARRAGGAAVARQGGRAQAQARAGPAQGRRGGGWAGLARRADRGSDRGRGATVERLDRKEHTSELQSRQYLVCRLLLEKKKKKIRTSNKGIG